MKTESDSQYYMRGHRVPALSGNAIQAVALRVCEIMKIRRYSFKDGRAEKVIAKFEQHGIHIDPVFDSEWLNATRAIVDPQKGMIYMPEALYSALCRGKGEAVRIFMHEIGHIVLGHRPLLHFSDLEGAPTQAEDSEWQADYFADAVLNKLGIDGYEPQLEFKF